VTPRNATYSWHIFGFEALYKSRTAQNTLWVACPSIHPATCVTCVRCESIHKILWKTPAKIQKSVDFLISVISKYFTYLVKYSINSKLFEAIFTDFSSSSSCSNNNNSNDNNYVSHFFHKMRQLILSKVLNG
jgi:hypothetical protein